MQKADSFEKSLMLGKIESRRRRGLQRMRWLGGITDSMEMSLSINSRSWWWIGVLQSVGLQRVGHDWVTSLHFTTPWKESYDQPRQHIKKQRHYFANKGPSCQGYGFSVVMCGCESWTINKAEHQRIDAFELWCWRRLLRVPWTARRSNQSILKEISSGCSLEGLMLKLKL